MTVHSLLTPENSTVIFIDHQPQMTFGVVNIDGQTLINNTVGLAKAAKIFNVPTILTTVETKGFSGYMWPQLLEIFPNQTPIERTSMNSWEEAKFVEQVERIGRKKLVIAALWTEVCLVFPAIQAIEAGYEVYAVVDASGGTSQVAHDAAIQRIVQAGGVPVTWQQVLLEYQRDWARKETYDAVMDLVKEHSGTYGVGVEYAYTMVHGAPPSNKKVPALSDD
ncbi:hydrolase [Nostoc sp. FACHB-892]|jgi:nicotinamidase-related amidase|uniref:hydrolase n=1 Tax=Nostoc sp. FACHB-892 TaxID=2692843 RepID=UPI001684B4D1|nr:hydrolase [Nostoc sp. FACHB-892]MBD2731513.1 hydrolase [Nostoc sp. FACHB-892]MBW4428915.1 hydrolase [Nostoc desertorum CM1-VF14]MBW4457994.1 hydrolase [Nostoc indistinguendum CM1-VF10]